MKLKPGRLLILIPPGVVLILVLWSSITGSQHTAALANRNGFILNATRSEINVVDTVSHTGTGIAIDTTPYGGAASDGALSPDGRWLYAALHDANGVLVVDTATHTPVESLAVGLWPQAVAFSADGAWAFVVNQGSNDVSVIDTSVPTVTTVIPVGEWPSGVASSPCLDKVYVTNGAGTVSVVDSAALRVSATIGGFAQPSAVVVSPYGHRAYVLNQGDGSIGIIDTASDRLVDTWPIRGAWTLGGMDITADGRKLLVTDAGAGPPELGTGVTFSVDAFTGQVLAAIPMGAFSLDGTGVEAFPAEAGPFSYASVQAVKVIDTASDSIVKDLGVDGGPNMALFPPASACLNGFVLASAETKRSGPAGATLVYTQTLWNLTGASDSFDLALSGQEWAAELSTENSGPIADRGVFSFSVAVQIPSGASAGGTDSVTVTATSQSHPDTAADRATLMAGLMRPGYVFNPDLDRINIVDTVLHIDTGTSIDTAPYGGSAWEGALSPDGQRLYASLRDANQVLVVDTATHTPVVSLAVPQAPGDIAFSPGGAFAFVANGDGVAVINTGGPAVTGTIPLADGAHSVATSPCLDRLYVAGGSGGAVSVIDMRTLRMTHVITGFFDPRDLAISPDGRWVYVVNPQHGSIGVIDTAGDRLAGTWPVPTTSPWGLLGIDVTPDGHTLLVIDGDGVTFALDAFTRQVVAKIPTDPVLYNVEGIEVFASGAGPFAYASTHDHMTSYDRGQIKVIDTETNTVVETIRLGGNLGEMALFPPETTCAAPPTTEVSPYRAHLPLVLRPARLHAGP